MLTTRLTALAALAVTASACSSAPSNDLHLPRDTTRTAPPTTTAVTASAVTTAEVTTSTSAPPDTMSAHPFVSTTIPVGEPTNGPTITETSQTTTVGESTFEPVAPTVGLDAVALEVSAQYNADQTAYNDCFSDPANCSFSAFDISNSPMDSNAHAALATNVSGNLRSIPGHGSVRDQIEAVKVNGDTAFITACTYDTVVIFQIGDPANPSDDAVFNEESVSYRAQWELRRLDGAWRIFQGTTLERKFGSDLCGF